MVADVWRFVADKIGTLRIRRLVKMCFYVSLKFQITDIYPVCLSVLKHASAKYATNAFSSKKNYEKLAVVVHVLQTTHNLVISRCCFAEGFKEMYKDL